MDAKSLSVFVAVLGTTISPYLWFWQASQEVEERIVRGRVRLWQRKGASEAELKYAAWDVNIGMIFSNLIMYFIILGSAATLFKTGKTDIKSAAEAAEGAPPPGRTCRTAALRARHDRFWFSRGACAHRVSCLCHG